MCWPAGGSSVPAGRNWRRSWKPTATPAWWRRPHRMTAAMQTGVSALLARFEGVRAQWPGDPAARAAAAELLRDAGLPGRREEAWKYTNLRQLAEANFHEPLTRLDDCD